MYTWQCEGFQHGVQQWCPVKGGGYASNVSSEEDFTVVTCTQIHSKISFSFVSSVSDESCGPGLNHPSPASCDPWCSCVSAGSIVSRSPDPCSPPFFKCDVTVPARR